MLATYHLPCAFPGCLHAAVMREQFAWPTASAPQPEIPDGWSIVLQKADSETVNVIAICGKHDFAFDGAKAKDMKPVGFQIPEAQGDEE